MTELLRARLPLGLNDFKRHLRLPFTVPEGVGALRVTLTFRPWGAGEVRSMINFSVFGPQGFAGAGHRHGTRHEALIGAAWATPGFLPGAPAPGGWTVVVHTHMVADVTEVQVVVEALEGLPEAPRAEPIVPPSPAPSGPWMLGDLHCHSTHSDARWTVRELAEAATARGLRFLALTDHNTTSGRAELARLAPHLLHLPGLELTTFYGHATVLGVPEYQDWTGLDPLRGAHERAAQVTDQGGLFTIAHPFAAGDPVCTGCAWTYFDLRPAQASHLEVWNGVWNQPHNVQALAYWYDLLAQGRRVIATAGTDAHGPEYAPGHGFTCTPTTPDPTTLLAQLRAGNTYLASAASLDLTVHTPAGPAALGSVQLGGRWTLTVRWSRLPDGCSLHVIVDGVRHGHGIPAAGQHTASLTVGGWLNVEIRCPDGRLWALTNPVWASSSPAQMDFGA